MLSVQGVAQYNFAPTMHVHCIDPGPMFEERYPGVWTRKKKRGEQGLMRGRSGDWYFVGDRDRHKTIVHQTPGVFDLPPDPDSDPGPSRKPIYSSSSTTEASSSNAPLNHWGPRDRLTQFQQPSPHSPPQTLEAPPPYAQPPPAGLNVAAPSVMQPTTHVTADQCQVLDNDTLQHFPNLQQHEAFPPTPVLNQEQLLLDPGMPGLRGRHHRNSSLPSLTLAGCLAHQRQFSYDESSFNSHVELRSFRNGQQPTEQSEIRHYPPTYPEQPINSVSSYRIPLQLNIGSQFHHQRSDPSPQQTTAHQHHPYAFSDPGDRHTSGELPGYDESLEPYHHISKPSDMNYPSQLAGQPLPAATALTAGGNAPHPTLHDTTGMLLTATMPALETGPGAQTPLTPEMGADIEVQQCGQFSVQPMADAPSGVFPDEDMLQRFLHAVGAPDSSVKATVDPRKYKTKLCKAWEECGHCSYEGTCCFAHGPRDLRSLTDNHKLLASVGYFSNVVLLAMTNSQKPALPPYCLYQQPAVFRPPQTAEQLRRCGVALPQGVGFPFQDPLPAVIQSMKGAKHATIPSDGSIVKKRRRRGRRSDAPKGCEPLLEQPRGVAVTVDPDTATYVGVEDNSHGGSDDSP